MTVQTNYFAHFLDFHLKLLNFKVFALYFSHLMFESQFYQYLNCFHLTCFLFLPNCLFDLSIHYLFDHQLFKSQVEYRFQLQKDHFKCHLKFLKYLYSQDPMSTHHYYPPHLSLNHLY